MRLADAIRIGSQYRPQAVGTWIGFWGGSCAMGAAYEGVFGYNPLHTDEHATHIAVKLSEVFPILAKVQSCPECGDSYKEGYKTPLVLQHLSGAIACLNDSHGWTREEIADWVETIEATCKREHEDEQPIPVDPTKPEKKQPERELVPA